MPSDSSGPRLSASANRIVLLGAGGQAREVAEFVSDVGEVVEAGLVPVNMMSDFMNNHSIVELIRILGSHISNNAAVNI